MKVEIKGGRHIIVESIQSPNGEFIVFNIRLSPRIEELLDKLQEDGIEGLRGPPGPAGMDGAQGPPGPRGERGLRADEVGVDDYLQQPTPVKELVVGKIARHTGANQP